MQIKSIVTKMDAPFANGSHALLLIVVDGETEIKVEGFGADGQLIKLRNVGDQPAEDYDPQGIVDDAADRAGDVKAYNVPDFYGRALVWAEPFTIAHVVMDCLNNQ